MRKSSKRPSPRKKPLPSAAGIELLSLPGLPEIRKGDDLTRLIVKSARQSGLAFENGDILVIAQKIISKAEGCLLRLSTVKPSAQALQLASELKTDPRMVEVILRESRRSVRSNPVLIVETHHGFVCANAGVDHSNIPGRDFV